MNAARTFPVRVQQKTAEAEDIVSLELVAENGGKLPRFAAGSHIDVSLRPGLVRQYSLCNHPSERHRYLIGVLREPNSRGGSIAIHDEIDEGDLLTISGPKNHFPLVRARRYLLFAGGIGITPILAMAQSLDSAHADFELHYCTRSPVRAAFRDSLCASLSSTVVQMHYDDGEDAQKLQLDEMLHYPDHSTHIFVCGPPAFINFVSQTAERCQWRKRNVHFEHFGAALDSANDKPFEIELASTGEVHNVPVGQSVTDVLAEHGIVVDVACERGVCGTCVTDLLDGMPEHRDSFLTDQEKRRNDQFTPCCSRARDDRLLLDL